MIYTFRGIESVNNTLWYLQQYIKEVEPVHAVEEIIHNMDFVIVHKIRKYQVIPEDKPTTQAKSLVSEDPVGILGYTIEDSIKYGQVVTIHMLWIVPEFRGDFENLFNSMLSFFEEAGLKYIQIDCDVRTNRWVNRKTGSKAISFSHFGELNSFYIKGVEEKEWESNSEEVEKNHNRPSTKEGQEKSYLTHSSQDSIQVHKGVEEKVKESQDNSQVSLTKQDNQLPLF